MPIASRLRLGEVIEIEKGVLSIARIDAGLLPAEEKENRPENVAEQARGKEQRERSSPRKISSHRNRRQSGIGIGTNHPGTGGGRSGSALTGY